MAYGRLEGVNASYKDMAAICRNIKGMTIDEAIDFLNKVLDKKAAVLYPRWNRKMAHRKKGQRITNLNTPKGRFPQKESMLMIGLLKSVKAAAEAKSIDGKIIHAAATKKQIIRRWAPKGPVRRNDIELIRVEVVVG